MPSVDSSPRQTILAVCFGNLCRSPMAEALLRDRLPADRWTVISAGTHAIGGDPPTVGSQEAIAHVSGLDISWQRSSPLTVDLLQSSDYVFTMSRRQGLEGAALLPAAAAKIRLLGAFSPADGSHGGPADPDSGPADRMEVPDPMGSDPEIYEACCKRLLECAHAAASWLASGADPAHAPGPVADWIQAP